MGSFQSVGKQINGSKQARDEKDEKDEREKKETLVIIGTVILPHIREALDICNLSQVCKCLYTVVNTSETTWKQLVLSEITKFSKQSALLPSSYFVPSSKLPCHSWKQVFQQILIYEAERKEVVSRYKVQYKKHFRLAAALITRLPDCKYIPGSLFTTNPIPGFPVHPGACNKKVLKFSVNLIQIAAMYIDLLAHTSSMPEFKNEDFLAQAIHKYVNFLHLKHKYKNYTLVPTLEIEYVWVSHMLRPSMYINDCTSLFGQVIDHNIQLTNIYAYVNKPTALKETSELYFKEFGERYCHKKTIKKLHQQPHFSTTGIVSKDPNYKDHKRGSMGDAFCPPSSVVINRATAYSGEIGIMKGLKPSSKSIGLRVNDLLMDDMWLKEFKDYMSSALRYPLATNEFLYNDYDKSCDQPAGMRPAEVYEKMWKAYEKFLYMAAKYPPAQGHFVHPSYAIDVIWHSHMICPKIYAKEVTRWVGYFVDHEPWPNCETKDMEKSSDKTNELWEKEFGIALHEEHITRIEVDFSHMPLP